LHKFSPILPTEIYFQIQFRQVFEIYLFCFFIFMQTSLHLEQFMGPLQQVLEQ